LRFNKNFRLAPVLIGDLMSDNSSQDSSTHKCAHALCMCLIGIEQEYCSDYCKSADEWEPCQCGHEVCTPESLEESM